MLASFVSVLFAQADPAALQPSGKWEVVAEEQGCTVARGYGNDATVGFSTYVTSPNVVIVIAAPRKLLPQRAGNIVLQILPEASTLNLQFGVFDLLHRDMAMIKIFSTKSELVKITKAREIRVGNRQLSFRLDKTIAALDALDSCTRQLISTWGVDPELYVTGRLARLTGNLAQWFDRNSYPRAAKIAKASGRVVMLLTTSAEGKVISCKAVASADQRLDAGSCAIAMKRAVVVPPLNAEGQPIASYTVLPVVWRLD